MQSDKSIIQEVYAEQAQDIYDNWDQSDGGDLYFGNGGICDEIADNTVHILQGLGIEACKKEGPNHSSIEVEIEGQTLEFDIPYHIYEYKIKNDPPEFIKKEGVIFNRSDVIIKQPCELKNLPEEQFIPLEELSDQEERAMSFDPWT